MCLDSYNVFVLPVVWHRIRNSNIYMYFGLLKLDGVMPATRPHSAKDTHGKLTLNSGIGNSHWERPTSQLLVFNIPNGLSLLLLN